MGWRREEDGGLLLGGGRATGLIPTPFPQTLILLLLYNTSIIKHIININITINGRRSRKEVSYVALLSFIDMVIVKLLIRIKLTFKTHNTMGRSVTVDNILINIRNKRQVTPLLDHPCPLTPKPPHRQDRTNLITWRIL